MALFTIGDDAVQHETGRRGATVRHALILAAIYLVLFGISVASTLIVGATRQQVDGHPAAAAGEIESEGGEIESEGGEPDDAPPAGDVPPAEGEEPGGEPEAHVAWDLPADQGDRGAPGGDSDGDLEPAGSEDPGGDPQWSGGAAPSVDAQPLLAVVIDDWGYGWEAADAFLQLDVPLTVAVIPYLPLSRRQADAARARGHEVILHMPMEPLDGGWDLGEGTVTTAMSSGEIVEDVLRAWDSVPHVTGMNNHMGSRATADERVMRAVMAAVRAKGTYFLDSRTTAQSVAAEIAREMGVPYVQNDRFIDTDNDPERIRDRILAAARLAKARGWAVVIGHVHGPVYQGLVAALPALAEEGVRLAKLSQVVARATAARAAAERAKVAQGDDLE